MCWSSHVCPSRSYLSNLLHLNGFSPTFKWHFKLNIYCLNRTSTLLSNLVYISSCSTLCIFLTWEVPVMCHWHLQWREIVATFCVFESQLCGSYHVSSSHLILITSCHTWDLCGSAYIFRLPEKKNFWQHFVHIGSHLCGSFHVSSSYLIFGSYDTLLTWMAINMGGSCHAF